MVTTRKFLANLSMLTAGALAAKLITFLAVARMARALGTDLFGGVAFAVAFTMYFDLIISQGLDVYAIQEVARDRGALERRAAAILDCAWVSLLALGALARRFFYWPSRRSEMALLLLYGLTFLPSALSLKWVFQAVEEMNSSPRRTWPGQLVFAVFVLLFVGGRRACFRFRSFNSSATWPRRSFSSGTTESVSGRSGSLSSSGRGARC